jgi:hypothetical protein
MPIFKPPDPVTYSYVGVCAGVTGGLVRALYASLQPDWRWGKTYAPLVALCLGGLYGLTVWVGALLGAFSCTPAQVAPTARDILSFAIGLAGISGVIGAIVGLLGRFVLRRDIDPQDILERFAGSGIVLGLLLYALVPGLHF